MEPTLSQALHLLNGDTVNAKIQQGGLIAKLLADEEVPRGADHRALHPLPLAASRPTRSSTSSLPVLGEGAEPEAGAGRRLLGPAECREFMFNH